MYSLSSFCSAVDVSGDSLKYMEKVMSTEVYAGQTETGLINRDEREKPALASHGLGHNVDITPSMTVYNPKHESRRLTSIQNRREFKILYV